jgi:hypothetical protein
MAKANGGHAPRQKGNRLERALIKLLQDRGLGAERGKSSEIALTEPHSTCLRQRQMAEPVTP